MILSNKRITKALIRLRGCAGWVAPVLFTGPEDRFSCVEVPFIPVKKQMFEVLRTIKALLNLHLSVTRVINMLYIKTF